MISSAALLLLALSSAPSQDAWPQFRGPDGTASASLDAPVEEILQRVAWRAELPGTGHSSPVVHGDTVFVTTSTRDPDERVVLALALEDGKPRWSHAEPIEDYSSHELNDAAASTPVVDAERVYVSWVDGNQKVALALTRQGKLVWRKDLGSYTARHGGGASPILLDGVLIVANDNESDTSALYGLDPATGEVRWRRARTSSRASYATPAIQRPDGSGDGKARVLFASTAHGITCLEAASGELVWEEAGVFEQRCVATPVVAGGIVFASAGRGGGGEESVALRLDPGDGTSRRSFELRRGLPYVPSGVAADELLFLVSDGGIASCIKLADGSEVWRERIGGEYFGSPVRIDERVLIASRAGELVVLAATREFELLVRVELGAACYSTPAVAGGKLLVRTAAELVAFGAGPSAR